MERVTISVIIPTYNHEQYIGQAIESALHQVCNHSYEIIIGDDCSTDRTLEICQNYGRNPSVRILSHPRNLGLISNYRALFAA
jgi:glycosyltransferase involved in cell wall biosynthesis